MKPGWYIIYLVLDASKALLPFLLWTLFFQYEGSSESNTEK